DDERAVKHLDRWRRVAREAAMQSRRVWLPEIDGPLGLDDFSAIPGVTQADQGGAPVSAATATVLIGPEGGWSDAERGRFPAVTLAEPMLRTETAAVAAGVLICTFAGGPNSAQSAVN
ncbi:MAG: RsmE family RNA methyltransferase, partial [Acidimicrobiales bacterium]